MKKLCMVLLLIQSVFAAAAEKTVECGKWKLTFDDKNGYWTSLSRDNVAIVSNPAGVAPFNWGPAWPAGKEELPDLFRVQDHWMPDWDVVQGAADYKLESYLFEKDKDRLTLTYRIGEWTARDIVEFKVNGHPDILARTLYMVYEPKPEKGSRPAFFANVTLNFPIAKEGRYFFPGRMNIFSNNGPKAMTGFPRKGKEEAAWCNYPVFLLEKNKQTAVFLPDEYKDLANFQLTARKEHVFLQANFKSYGWAYPGKAQVIGPVYLKMGNNSLEQTFQGGIWSFFDEIGIKVPADRPEWLEDAMLYCLHPGGNVDAGLQNLGGFEAARKELLPRIANLGLNMIWVMPVEETGIYCPEDYRSIKAEYGTLQQYLEFIHAAHNAGMKVLQDIVPHGGRPLFAEKRGNKPWDLIFDKKGVIPGYGCFDYGSPDWREYINKVARDLVSKYDLDGFRIDVPDGNRQPNFRRNDDPAFLVPPKNVSAAWWDSELKKVNGKLPPHAFMRASNTRRESGVQILRSIRSAVKSVKPRNGVILGEVGHLPYVTEADIVYDMSLFSYYIRNEMAKRNPAEYVQGLSRYLEQQKLSEPRGTLRLRYTESHDSLRTRTAIGIAASRAWLALTFLIDGIPMVYQDMDIGDGAFIKELTKLRTSLPELRRGEAFYRSAEVSDHEIFSCVRRYQDKCSVGLINFSPNRIDSRVVVPASLLPGKTSVAWNCRTGEKLKFANGSFQIRLDPWEYTVIAFRPEGESSPVRVPACNTPRTVSAGKVKTSKNEWGSLLVKTPSYELNVGSSGMLNHFNNQNGISLFEKIQFVYDSVLEQDSPLIYEERPAHMIETDYGVEIKAAVRVAAIGSIGLIYRCYDDRVEMTISRKNLSKQHSVGLLLPIKGAKQWRVNTAEGVLEDDVRLRGMSGQTGMNKHRVYRMKGTPMLWRSTMHPLDFNQPGIDIMTSEGEISIELKDPLHYQTVEAMLLDRYRRKNGLYVALFWANPEKPFPEKKKDEELTIVLRNGPPKKIQDGNWTKLNGGLNFRNESLGWKIANRYYSIKLLRTGGVISELRDQRGCELIREQELFASSGFFPKKYYCTSVADIDSSVRIWENNAELHMEFCGMLRTPGSAWTSIIRPGIFFMTKYTFDSSAEIRVQWAIMNEMDIKSAKAESGISMKCPSSGLVWWQYANGKKQKVSLNAATPDGKELAFPQALDILAKNGAGVRIQTESGFKSVYTARKQLYLRLDFPGEYIRAGTWTTACVKLKINQPTR